ncbi:MFS transporter [Paenibacillus sp. TRM 82003]|nr:MFS transporter [Paenibacillus sp. TRM 82003]
MTIYFARELGAWIAGIALTGGVVLSFFVGFWSGYVSDKRGRKRLMIAAELVWLAAYGVLAWSTSDAFAAPWIALAASIAIHAGWGLYGPASDGMLLDVTEPKTRKYMYTVFYWSNNLAIALGGMLGAMLFAEHLTEMLLLLTGMTLVTGAITVWKIEETHFPGREQVRAPNAPLRNKPGARDMLRSYGRVLRDRTFMLFCLANLLVLSSEWHLGNYIGVRLAEEMGMRTLISAETWALRLDGVEMLGLLRTENTLLVVIFSLFAATVMRRFKDRHTLFGGMLLYVAGYAFLMFGDQPWPLIAAMALATWGEVINAPIRMSYNGVIVPDDARGAYLAVESLTGTGAMMIGTLAVSLGAVASSATMGALAFIVGMAGFAVFASIIDALDVKLHGAENEEAPTPAAVPAAGSAAGAAAESAP